MTLPLSRRDNFFRPFSWLVLLLAFVAPGIWASVQLSAFEQVSPKPGCGLPVLGIYSMAVIGAGALSLIAAGLGWAAFRGLPKPRPRSRRVELGVLLTPAMLCVGLVALFLAFG
jgi:hypothetical protein